MDSCRNQERSTPKMMKCTQVKFFDLPAPVWLHFVQTEFYSQWSWFSQQEGEIWITKENKNYLQHDKINILAQADTHIGTHVELASCLSLSVSTLHNIVKNCEEIEKKLHLVWTFLQAAEITTTFTTGICTCYMVQRSTSEWCFHRCHPP
jgi:hypothetical protein